MNVEQNRYYICFKWLQDTFASDLEIGGYDILLVVGSK